MILTQSSSDFAEKPPIYLVKTGSEYIIIISRINKNAIDNS